MDQPSKNKVANPARCQLNRKSNISLSLFAPKSLVYSACSFLCSLFFRIQPEFSYSARFLVQYSTCSLVFSLVGRIKSVSSCSAQCLVFSLVGRIKSVSSCSAQCLVFSLVFLQRPCHFLRAVSVAFVIYLWSSHIAENGPTE